MNNKKLQINSQLVGRPIRCNKQNLEIRKKNYTEVVFIGDIHWGSASCDKERVKRMLDYCYKNDIYVFLMGDLIECATRNSVSDVYSASSPQIQYEEILNLLIPLAKKHLILGALDGNHELRVYKESGILLTKAWCRELHIPYLGFACWNYWKVGKQRYTIYALHGSSASRFVYTKLKALIDISHNFDADLLAMGHVHDSADTSMYVQYYDSKSKTIKEKKKFVVITGHYLKYDDSYAQGKGLPIGKMGSPKVKFFADKRDLHISW